MNIPERFIKRFPAYEDVFIGNLEHHRKHFLPICSINLQFLFPEQHEWLHFVSVKEIHEGCVGENTQQFHTLFTKEDMLGFDVIDGKYKFEADWNYFSLHQKEQLEATYEALKSTGDKAYLRMKREVMALDGLEQVYMANEQDYQARKAFFLENNKLYPYSSFGEAKKSVEELTRDFEEKQTSGWGLSFLEVNGILMISLFSLTRLKVISRNMTNLWKRCSSSSKPICFMCLNVPMVRLLPISVPLPGIIFKRVGRIPSIYFTTKN